MPLYPQLNPRLQPIVQYTTPTTGSTITVQSDGTVNLIINPAGTILALTVTLPSSPVNGDSVTLMSSQIVTGLTMNGGTIIGALTSLAVATFAQYIYSAASSNWFRAG